MTNDFQLKFSHWQKYLLDFIFPAACVNCGRVGEWLCARCAGNIRGLPPMCFSCQKYSPQAKICPECADKYFFSRLIAPLDYDQPAIARLIKIFKYHFAYGAAPALADLAFANLPENLQKDLGQADFMTAVPLHRRRLKWRGFNQAELLAQEWSTKLNIKYMAGLQRLRHTQPQAQLSGAQRLRSQQDNFLWTGENLIDKVIILVDDVATTGATVNDCARALKIAGAGEVLVMVVAKG